MEKTMVATPVYVGMSPLHGRGLFADRAIKSGEVIGVWPLLILSIEDTQQIKSTLIYHYVFYIDEDEHERRRCAVAFGLISMCNHSENANGSFFVDREAQTLTLSAARDINADDEIFIDYEEFASETF